MSAVRFTCPECGAVEDPMLHTLHSSCRGEIEWRGAYPYCTECGDRIYQVRCDECGERPSLGEALS